MMRVRLNELGQKHFRKTPGRIGDFHGESKLRNMPTRFQLPRWRVRWDGTDSITTVLKAYVVVFEID